MRQVVFSLLLLLGFCGCIDTIQNFAEDSSLATSGFFLDQEAKNAFWPEMMDVKLQVQHEGIFASGAMTISLVCDNVFGNGMVGDWTSGNISITSGSTVSVITGKACSITLLSYNDGANTYTGSSLIISISSNGIVTSVLPQKYSSQGDSPVFQWFVAAQGSSSYTITINYAADTISSSPLTQTTLAVKTYIVGANGVTAPSVSNVTITQSLSSNTFQYTLTASVSGSTSCVFINNSSQTYTPTSWSSVNAAYSASGATTCPNLISGSATSGNWTSNWQYGVKYLVIWVNLVSGVNAYTTANIGP